MALLDLQRTLAALLMEEPARRAFAADPLAYARAAGLPPKDARLLASVDPDDLAYFATRRQVDRRVMLSADLPRSARLLGEPRAFLPYFRAHPYAFEDPLKEAARFAKWARRHAPADLADVALYEATVLRLAARPHRTARPSRHPKAVPGLALLRLGHLVHGRRPEPMEPACYVLVRTPDDVMWYRVAEVDLQLLDKAKGRLPEAAWLKAAAAEAGVSLAEARRSARELRAEGLFAPPAD